MDNSPLRMNGSESLSERIYLYNNVYKIIFVSKWVQKTFFVGMHGYNINSTEVVYPSIHK